MEKKYFAVKLNPCRPTFAFDMNEEERSIMQAHMQYWRDFMQKGKIVVFGPVLDNAGPYGLGILCVDDEQEVKDFIEGDPAGQINSFEFHPMMAVVPSAN